MLMFLENADTSLRMVWESYPVLRLLLVLVAFLVAVIFALNRLSRGLADRFAPPWSRIAGSVLVTFLLLGAMWGKWSRYPLRWGEAFEAKQAFNAHLALNPILFFLETRAEMDGGFDLAKVRASQKVMADYFGVPVTTDKEGLPSLRREGRPLGMVQGEPNVVFIQLESLAGFKTGIGCNPFAATPFRHLPFAPPLPSPPSPRLPCPPRIMPTSSPPRYTVRGLLYRRLRTFV